MNQNWSKRGTEIRLYYWESEGGILAADPLLYLCIKHSHLKNQYARIIKRRLWILGPPTRILSYFTIRKS